MVSQKKKKKKKKHLIDDIATDRWSFGKFARMKDKKKCNPIMDLSKFTFNKKISSGVATNTLFI